MCHRIRAGLANEDFRKLMGIVEVDETRHGALRSSISCNSNGAGMLRRRHIPRA